MFSRNLKNLSLTATLLNILPVIPNIIVAKLISDIIRFAINKNMNNVIYSAIAVIILEISVNAITGLISIHYEKKLSKKTNECRLLLYEKIFSSPKSMFEDRTQGQIMENLTDDLDTVIGRYTEIFPSFFSSIITSASYFLFILFQSDYIAVMMLIMALFQIIPPFISKKYMQINYENCRNIEAKLSDFTLSAYRGFIDIKLFKLKNWWINKLRLIHKQYYKIGNTSIITNSLENVMETTVESLLKYGTYMIIGLLTFYKFSTVEAAIQAVALSGGFFAAIKSLFFVLPKFALTSTAESRLLVWEVDKRGKNIASLNNYVISLRDISFSYENKMFLNKCNMQIDIRKINLIRGGNGCGKTTLLKLIIGLLKCSSGEISVGGINSYELPDSFFPKEIFYLPQNEGIWNFSALELYKAVLGSKTDLAQKSAVEFGVAKALLSNSHISRLSGGERKKIYLALAFALNPQLLILDEPTNSLDEKGKEILIDKLKKYNGGAIIVSHDAIFDEIAECKFEMKDGELFENKTGNLR